MKKDCYGLPVTTDSAEVIKSLNHFHQELLNSGTEGAKILDAAKAFPNAFLIQCYAAALLLYAQENVVDHKALVYIDAAEKLLDNMSEREKLILQAIKAWYRVDYELALTLFTDLTSDNPTDCTSAKMAEWLYYCYGQAYHAKPFLTMCEKMHDHCKQHAGFLAMHSFALELSGRYQEAKDMAFAALKLNPHTPWAHHTISHVMLNTSHIDEGIKLFEQYSPTWDDILPPLRGHLYWHYALFYIAKRDLQAAAASYQGKMWGKNPDTVLEQIDAIAYLWRMEMAGELKIEALEEVMKHKQSHPFEFYSPFNNAHYMYALSRIDDFSSVERMLEFAERHIQTLHGNDRKLWENVGLPLLRGCEAFGQHKYKDAVAYFKTALEKPAAIGGSDAQDEVFYQAYLFSLMKSGNTQQAEAILKQYLPHYADTELGAYWKTL